MMESYLPHTHTIHSDIQTKSIEPLQTQGEHGIS